MDVDNYISVFLNDESVLTRPASDALFLPGWGREEWSKLLSRTVPQRHHAREMVIQRGIMDRTLNFVVSGTLEVGILQVDGVSIVQLAHIRAGSVVGEQSFFDNQPRVANVWATSDVEILRLDFEAYEKFSKDEPALTRDLLFALARVLSLRLRNTSFRVRR